MTDARSTKGEEIKNENDTPIGKPALVKPMKIGIEEQEQNGVTVPSNAPMIFPGKPLNLVNILLVLSGVKCDWIYDDI
jgi:hypothetical protein